MASLVDAIHSGWTVFEDGLSCGDGKEASPDQSEDI